MKDIPENYSVFNEIDFYLDILQQYQWEQFKWKQRLYEESDNPYYKQQYNKYAAKIISMRTKIKKIITR